ncbi:MAG: DUF2752 domain-containing protein [Myxococcota bacterium]
MSGPVKFERAGALLRAQIPWRVYNGILVGVAIAVLAASWALHPGPDARWVYLPTGAQFGDTCAFLAFTGQPCPQCGMTRSFVWAARGHLVEAFWYSPGGLGLFLWSQVAGVLGAIRLIRRDGDAFPVPLPLSVGWAFGWTILLYAVPYGLRLGGWNPLP